MRKILICFLLGLLITGMFSVPVHSEDQTVRVGYTVFENYQEGYEGEYKRGFGYEYLQRIAYSTGWSYEYVYGSFSQLLEMLSNGEIDIMGDLSYTQERAQTISYSSLPQGKETYYIYTMPDRVDIDPMDQETLEGKTIGAVTGTYQYGLLTDYLDEKNLDVQIVDFASSSQMCEALQENKVDAMVLTDMASSGRFLPTVSLGSSDFYFGVNKSRPDLLEQLNEALYEIQVSDPYYNEITYSKYINSSSLTNSYLSVKEKEWLKEKDYTITLGYLKGNLPYCDIDADGELTGFYSILARRFESLFGIKVEAYAYDDMAAISEDFYQGKLDLYGPAYKDEWLAEQHDVLMSKAVNTTTFVMLYHVDNKDQTTDTIAYGKNRSAQYGAIEVLYPKAELLKCEDQQACLQAIVEGKADSMLVPAIALNHLRNYPEMDKMKIVELSELAEVGVCTLRQNSELLNIVNRVITASSDDLSGAALMDYTYEAPVFSLYRFAQENFLYVILFLILVIVVIIVQFTNYVNSQIKVNKMKRRMLDLSFKAFRDALTKTGNRAGYLEHKKELQELIDQNKAEDFALIIADINNLKKTNDHQGHDTGDILIRNTGRIICHVFDYSPVFRIGGDEFLVLLQGQDYENRHELFESFKAQSTPYYAPCDLQKGEACYACGMAEYRKGIDTTVDEVFERADEQMYLNKDAMKTGGKKKN